MHDEILAYLKKNNSPENSEEAIFEWWQGLQGLSLSVDDLTEAIEELEDRGAIEKKSMEKDFFIYSICEETA